MHELRRSTRPYIAFALPLLFVTGLVAVVWLKQGDNGGFVAILVLWLGFGIWTQLGLRNRIYWSNDAVTRKAAGLSDLVLPFKRITEVRLEGPNAKTLFQRPFRCIAICSHDDSNKACIYISLKHFVSEDIRALLRAIQMNQPRIQLPAQWS